MNTIAETLIQQGVDQGLKQGLDQGLKQGLDQGLKQGLDQGLKQGQSATLLKLLEIKFGPLDAEVRQRVVEADRELLDRWCERVLKAVTLSDVLG